MGTSVNLDALIQREDFLASDGVDAGNDGKSEASRTDLTKGESFFLTLRKPDFQRETAAWSSESVRDFIRAFIQGDLIPSVICWMSPTRLTFVIDGAHRFSALIAWLQDDYGDGEDSIKFYGNNIPDQQRKIAQKTRDLVNKSIGPYKDFKAETQNPGTNPKLTTSARALAHSRIPLLWVKGQDSKKAERAFLTINQSAVQIDPTELRILNSRFRPNAIASRAIVRNSTGHKYWKGFSVAAKQEIESLGKEIYGLLYSPPLDPPIRTLEIPIAGHGYGSQTLPLIFDFVNISNGIPVIDVSKVKGELQLSVQQSASEAETLEAMRNAGKLARIITGTHPSSLGLHPAVYFYAENGRHQPTTVLAMAALLKEIEKKNGFIDFTSRRARFESFLLGHKQFVNKLTVKYGSMSKGYRQLKEYYQFILDQLGKGLESDQIEFELRSQDKYQSLVMERPVLSEQTKKFSSRLKQLAFVKQALEKTFFCELCKARIDHKSMHMDHIQEKSQGGVATLNNSQWLHPYCDSTYKTHLVETKQNQES